MEWRRSVALIGVVAATVVGCGSGDSAVCVSNDVGDVCADESDGAISFSASGLAPGSDVQMLGPGEDPFVLQIDDDGSYAPPPGSIGFLYAFADTEFTFAVTATDSNGDEFGGDIVISN